MIAAFMIASSLSLESPQGLAAVPDECEFLHAVLVAQWPLESPGQHETFNLDTQSRDRPIFYESDGQTEVVADAAFVAELLPRIDPATAAEFASYFGKSEPHRILCDFAELRVKVAASSREGALDRQETLEFPRISLSKPMFSSNGRYAMGGYAWSFVPYHWQQDDCLFERVHGAWRMVECITY